MWENYLAKKEKSPNLIPLDQYIVKQLEDKLNKLAPIFKDKVNEKMKVAYI